MLLDFIKNYGTIAVPIGFLAMLLVRSGYYKFDDNLRRSFVVLIFATISYYSQIGFALFVTSKYFLPLLFTWFLSAISTLSIAIIWRKWGSDWYFKHLNKYGISNENERGSVLNTIIQDNTIHINGVSVYTKCGKVYSCSSFNWVRNNINLNTKFIIDEKGVFMPVTHIKYKDNTTTTNLITDLQQPEGICHTYIPMSEIHTYDFIIMKK